MIRLLLGIAIGRSLRTVDPMEKRAPLLAVAPPAAYVGGLCVGPKLKPGFGAGGGAPS